jgi:hypothetical protein
MAFLSLNDQSSKTAACYITAINFRCKLYQNVDISHNFIAKKMLQGSFIIFYAHDQPQ